VHAAAKKIPLTGFADHLSANPSTSDDPSNGSRSTPIGPELWKWDSGTVTMATDQLVYSTALLALTDTRTTNYPKLRMAFASCNMHLRVGDLERRIVSYSGAIGLDPTRNEKARVPVVGTLSPPPRYQCLAEFRCRPALRCGQGLPWFRWRSRHRKLSEVSASFRLRQAGAPA